MCFPERFGPNYVVRETVRNDGLVNTYDIETQYGLLTVESTGTVPKRIAELNALWKLQQLKGMSIYAESFKKHGAKSSQNGNGVSDRSCTDGEGGRHRRRQLLHQGWRRSYKRRSG